jgi:hypothetical protein
MHTASKLRVLLFQNPCSPSSPNDSQIYCAAMLSHAAISRPALCPCRSFSSTGHSHRFIPQVGTPTPDRAPINTVRACNSCNRHTGRELFAHVRDRSACQQSPPFSDRTIITTRTNRPIAQLAIYALALTRRRRNDGHRFPIPIGDDICRRIDGVGDFPVDQRGVRENGGGKGVQGMEGAGEGVFC